MEPLPDGLDITQQEYSELLNEWTSLRLLQRIEGETEERTRRMAEIEEQIGPYE